MKLHLAVALSLLCAAPAFAAPTYPSPEASAAILKQMGLREDAKPVRELKGWEKPKKIVVGADTPERIKWFQEVVKGVELVPARNPREALAGVTDADALVGFCQPNVVGVGAKLKWVQSQLTGVEDCLTNPKVKDGSILLTNTQRLNGPNVSEHAMALLLALTRKINTSMQNQVAGHWDDKNLRGVVDLDGKTMLVVGLGGIGTDIAKRAAAFDMKVTAIRNTSREGPPFVAKVGLPADLPNMIGEADVVVNATPLTPETTNMFNAALFAKMKPGAIFINIGRGESVVTDDLVAALQPGKLGGAGLDVIVPDPLPQAHPIWKLPNVVITPHIGSFSEQRLERSWVLMRENMRRFVAGDKMLSVVDIKRGY